MKRSGISEAEVRKMLARVKTGGAVGAHLE